MLRAVHKLMELDTKGLQGCTHTDTPDSIHLVCCVLMPLLCFVHNSRFFRCTLKSQQLCAGAVQVSVQHLTACLFATHNSSQGHAHLQRQEECK